MLFCEQTKVASMILSEVSNEETAGKKLLREALSHMEETDERETEDKEIIINNSNNTVKFRKLTL